MKDPIFIYAIWFSIIFIIGIIIKQFKLPSLIGFLIAGIIINFLEIQNENIHKILPTISNIGITLLLFTIGLKIKVKSIFKKEIFLTATYHVILISVIIGSYVFLLSYLFSYLFGNLSWTSSLLIGFALSLSSTVFVVKVFEERGEINAYHSKIAIGILVIQDIFAVLFLTLSNQEVPSLWALLLPIYIYLVQFPLKKLLSNSGHGELLTVFGFFAALIAGSFVFYSVGIKSELGALVIGMLLVNHKKAHELYDRMMSYKDFFLIGFFVSVGLTGLPNINSLLIALLIIPFMFVKTGLFVIMFSSFKMRARTAFLASIGLSNYSEFALITASVGSDLGILPKEWTLTFALLMAFSFLISSPINTYAHNIFDKYRNHIMKLNTGKKYIDEEPKSIDDAEVIIIGYGSVGKTSYKYFKNEINQKVIAIDYNHEIVKKYKHKGININWGDTTNSIFWDFLDLSKVKMVVIATTEFSSNINILDEINKLKDRKFKIAAMCSYIDEAKILKEKKVDYVYNYKLYLGADFAEHTFEKYIHRKDKTF